MAKEKNEIKSVEDRLDNILLVIDKKLRDTTDPKMVEQCILALQDVVTIIDRRKNPS